METSVHGGIWKPDHHLPSVSLPRAFYLLHDPIIYYFRSHPGCVLHTHAINTPAPLLLGISLLAFASSITPPCASCFKAPIYSSERKCIKEWGWWSVQSGRGGKRTQHWLPWYHLNNPVDVEERHGRSPFCCLTACDSAPCLRWTNETNKWKYKECMPTYACRERLKDSERSWCGEEADREKRSKSASEWKHVWMRESEKRRDLEATRRRTGWDLETNKQTKKKRQQFSFSLHLQLAAIWRRSLAAPWHHCGPKVGQSEYSCGSVLHHHTTGLPNELSVRLTFDEIIFTVSHLVPVCAPF